MLFSMMTLMIKDLRMVQIQGIKGRGRIPYREPFTTQQILYYQFFRRVTTKVVLIVFQISSPLQITS